MVQLTGNSLSKRHQDLNTKVNEAAASGVNFDEVISEMETSDVDRLYKIDLAAKCKKIDYIIETLKSGDPVYTSRALKKALWLYDDEYSNIINTDNLHHNIFPFMSIKMKKKFITTISVYLKNKDQIEQFYNYCLQVGMTDFAQKFLINTSEAFKLKLIQEKAACILDIDNDKSFMKSFLENSFVLFEAYLEQQNCYRINSVLRKCSYFYTISDLKYLDLLEKHMNSSRYGDMQMGLRISKDILTKHKKRVLGNPSLYVKILNVKKLLRHSNLSDIKVYVVSLLPTEASMFWEMGYYRVYKSIINAIPENERYSFVKKMFIENYPTEVFEMSKEFYDQNYHDLMTAEEREAWALEHIASGKEVAGAGRDHMLYKYVRFEVAFVEIKKLIRTAVEQPKRFELLKVLPHSAKTQRDLEALFNYYYERHVNEKKNHTESFLRAAISVHKVFDFDSDCWKALNKIFHSIDVYNTMNTHCDPDFKIVSIIYHIINNKEMPDVLIRYMEYEISMYSTKRFIDMLNEEKKQQVYTYVIDFYLERIKKIAPTCRDDKSIAQIHFALEFMAIFKKSKNDIPDAIMTIINQDSHPFRHQQILQEKRVDETVTEDDLVRYLKEDSKLVVDKIPIVEKQFSHHYFKLNKLMKKLKIYFPHDDVTQRFIKLFNDILTDINCWYYDKYAAVYGLFILFNEKDKVDLMNKFAPTDPKIDHDSIDRNVLIVRESICRFACYSRPPVPLSSILMYLKGDYVKYCLPMFHMYLSSLPQPLCLKFVESLIDAPVSIQKHGLRLAFKCFNTENLNKLVLNAWKSSKNVSLRSVIYKAFFEKTVKQQDREMFETLKALTLDLHNDDDDEIFSLIISKKMTVQGCESDFIEAVWTTVDKLKDNERNLSHKTDLMKLISDVIHLMKKDTVKKIVTDDIILLFGRSKAETLDDTKKVNNLHLAKWQLVVHYIVYFTRSEEDRSESIEMSKLIIGKCIEGWNAAAIDYYVNRRMYAEFIQHLKQMRFLPDPTHAGAIVPDVTSFINVSVIFEMILNELLAAFPLHEIYIHVWDLRIALINRQVVKECCVKFENDSTAEVVEECAIEYGEKLGGLVTEFVQSNTYVSYFASAIAGLINKTAFDIEYYFGLKRNFNYHRDHILVSIARGLLETKAVETNLLSLHLLPTDPKCSLTVYKPVYDMIETLPDFETKCYFNQKFTGDYKRRRFE